MAKTFALNPPVDPLPPHHRLQELVDAVFIISFEDEARDAVIHFHCRVDPDPNACENYTLMFLADYKRALYWKHTTADCFLDAYAHKALAILNGADPAALDREAYELRQGWAEVYSKKGERHA